MKFNLLSSLGLLSVLANVSYVRSANVCLLLYQMADNDLEYFIRADLEEFTKSPLIQASTLTSWVYFDHRNFGTDFDIVEPMPFVFNKDGSSQTGQKQQGSFYFKQDKTQQKLVIEQSLGELNSDLADTVKDFVNTALADCKAQGAEEYMVAFSSHGAGFGGFGGDEHNRKRKLVQRNTDIVGALRSALDTNLGAGKKFDVVGFDACLMQAFGAADDYKSVAKYLLASEETEPGHGWWYEGAPASAGGSALEIAKYFQSSFLTETHGESEHQVPKTLSIVDLEKFENSFLVKWEALSKELASLLTAKDPEVGVMLGRARQTAYAFESYVDEAGTKKPSNVDMLSFMKAFKKLCPAGTDTKVGAALQDAMTSYDDMFVANGNGENTPSGLTGMHVLFPTKNEYAKYSDFYQQVLYDDAAQATQAAPEWLNFLKSYYGTATSAVGGESVCQSSAGAAVDAGNPNKLLINPTVSGITASGGHDISMEVARTVDSILIEYGIELTPFLYDGRRSLGKSKRAGETGKSYLKSRYGSRFNRMVESMSKRRRLDGHDNDYLYGFAGDLLGDYDKSKYSATWDRTFWAIGDVTGASDGIYVEDMGEGLKDAPIIYFPPNAAKTADDISSIYYSIDQAIDDGGEFGYITFSSNSLDPSTNTVTSFSLFTDSDGKSFSEVPLSAGGQIAPIIFCFGSIEGEEIYELVGGLESTLIDWTFTNVLYVTPFDAGAYMTSENLEYLTVDIIADDEDTGGYSYASFDITQDGAVNLVLSFDVEGERSTAGPPKDGPPTDKDEKPSGAASKVASFGLFLVISTVFVI